MSEPREECYKCLNGSNCISSAEYGSLYCVTNRKFNKTADEMFEKLKYKKKKLDFVFSRFWEEWENEDLAKTFSFNTEYETLDFTDENCYGITMQELAAINAKCKELGWIK